MGLTLRPGSGTEEVADYLGISVNTLRYWRAYGEGRPVVGSASTCATAPTRPTPASSPGQHRQTNQERWLFQSGNALLNRNSAGQWWRLIRAKVGMEEFTLHGLRHFYASALIAAGRDVVTVQRALGHVSASIILNTYSHLWPTAEDRTRAAAAELMRIVGVHAAD